MRLRISAAVALLVALALTGAGAIVYAIEWQRIQDQVVSEIDQELAEFATVQENGLNRETGAPFNGVGDMLDTFLARNVPGDNEILVSWYGDRPQTASSDGRFTNSDLFENTVRPLIGTNQTVRIDIPGYGEAMITVQSVRDSDAPWRTAPMTTCRSPSGSPSCWPGCACGCARASTTVSRARRS